MTDVVEFKHANSPAAPGKPLHYTQCGLDNIYLVNGFQQREAAGEVYTAVKDVEDLHASIALCLARKKVLSGQEIRFLRKHLEYTQKDLGDHLGVSDQSIARYEKDRGAMDASADGLFRLLVIGKALGCVDVHAELEKLRLEDDEASDTLLMGRDHDEWRPAAAA